MRAKSIGVGSSSPWHSFGDGYAAPAPWSYSSRGRPHRLLLAGEALPAPELPVPDPPQVPEVLLERNPAPAGAAVHRQANEDGIRSDLLEIVDDARELIPDSVEIVHPFPHSGVPAIDVDLQACHRGLEFDVACTHGDQSIGIAAGDRLGAGHDQLDRPAGHRSSVARIASSGLPPLSKISAGLDDLAAGYPPLLGNAPPASSTKAGRSTAISVASGWVSIERIIATEDRGMAPTLTPSVAKTRSTIPSGDSSAGASGENR